MKTGIELIAQERQEQLNKHGRTIALDVELNYHFQLGYAAATLCLRTIDEYDIEIYRPFGWDGDIWKKMCSKSYNERLIIAGALIAAEIDRLNHIAPTP